MKEEEILSNEVFAEVPEEKRGALVEYINRVEQEAHSKATGEIYRNLDETISKVSGMSREPGDEKTYTFAERVINHFKTEAEKYPGQIAELQQEKSRLEGLIAKGGTDAELSRKYSQAVSDLETMKAEYEKTKADLTTKETEYQTKLRNVEVDYALQSAVAGLKFAPEVKESVKNLVVKNALGRIKQEYRPDIVEDEKTGMKTVVFRNEAGDILKNAANGLNPFSVKEILVKELTGFEVLAPEKSGGGGGTGNGKTDPDTPDAISTAGAKTQVEANEIITQALMRMGYKNGSPEFQKLSTEAFKANKCLELPLN